MDGRLWLDFVLAKGFVRELTHVAEVTECVSNLIEPGCGLRRGSKSLAGPANPLRSTAPPFVLSRTPEDAYHNASFFSKTTATIHVFLPQTGRIFAIGRCPTPVYSTLIPPRTCILSNHPPVPSFLDPRYHCSTSNIQPWHRRRHAHRPPPFHPPPSLHDFFSPSVERLLAVEQAWNWSTKCSPLYPDVPGAAQ